MTNLYNILRSRDITLPTKVFSVVKYGCENWTIKKAERRGPEAFEPWCLRRFLRVPWTARRSNQSILKEISPGCSLEGLMLKLKLQYFGHLLRRADSFEKTLMLGKIEGGRRRDDRGWDGWTASPTQWTWVWAGSGSWWRTQKPGVAESGTTEQLNSNNALSEGSFVSPGSNGRGPVRLSTLSRCSRWLVRWAVRFLSVIKTIKTQSSQSTGTQSI